MSIPPMPVVSCKDVGQVRIQCLCCKNFGVVAIGGKELAAAFVFAMRMSPCAGCGGTIVARRFGYDLPPAEKDSLEASA